MCHMLQLFEDRLVELYEAQHGAAAAQERNDKADQVARVREDGNVLLLPHSRSLPVNLISLTITRHGILQ